MVSLFGDSLIAVILHGSVATGEYLPGKSDVDLLVVIESPLSPAEQNALTDLARGIRESWPSRLDLRIVLKSVALAPTQLPSLEAYVHISQEVDLTEQVQFRVLEADLVPEFSICRSQGVSLFGLSPREAIGEIPAEWVLGVGDDQMAGWQQIGDDPPWAELTVLTACRVWAFAEDGVHLSKRQAGEWALRRDPSMHVVRQALDQRLVDPSLVIEPDGVQQLLQLVRRRVADYRR